MISRNGGNKITTVQLQCPETLPALKSLHVAQQSKNSLVIMATNRADHLEYAAMASATAAL